MYTEHLRIPVGAGSMHAERVGRAGQPFVLVHGFGTCAFLWRAVAPRLADAGHSAIALDLLGYGESDRPIDVAYDLAAQAEYVERALTALRLPPVIVVGQDIGAIVALLLAAGHPRRVARVALLNPPDPTELPGPAIRALQRTSARAALGANALVGAMALLEPLLRSAVANPAHMSDRLLARYLAPWVGSDGVSRLLQLASAADLPLDEGPSLDAVRAPTLLLQGAEDKWASPATAAALAASIPNARVVADTVANAGHLLAEDAPDDLVDRLLAWLAGTEATK